MRGVVPDSELQLITSKSWRQVPITWSLLARLTPAQQVALGTWTDRAADQQLSQMPLRYTGAKQYQSLLVKHTFMLFILGCAGLKQKCDRWDQISAQLYERMTTKAMAEASVFLGQPERIFYAADAADVPNSLQQRVFSIRVRGRATPVVVAKEKLVAKVAPPLPLLMMRLKRPPGVAG